MGLFVVVFVLIWKRWKSSMEKPLHGIWPLHKQEWIFPWVFISLMKEEKSDFYTVAITMVFQARIHEGTLVTNIGLRQNVGAYVQQRHLLCWPASSWHGMAAPCSPCHSSCCGIQIFWAPPPSFGFSFLPLFLGAGWPRGKGPGCPSCTLVYACGRGRWWISCAVFKEGRLPAL